MGHFSKITNDKVSIDIFSYCYCKFGLVTSEGSILKNFFDSDSITFLVWYLYTDESQPRNRCLDTDRFCFESEGEVFFEGFYLGESDSFTRSQTVLYHSWTDTLIFHLYIDTELEKCPLYKE